MQLNLKLSTRHFHNFLIYDAMEGRQNVSGGGGGRGELFQAEGRPDGQTKLGQQSNFGTAF
jgi:hypothetical protein